MKYSIITFGCQMNKSDSERIASVLEKSGYKPVKADSSAEALAKADLIVVNMCSVRQSAVDRVYGKINQISKIKNQNDKVKCKIILTGCILPKDKKKLKNQVDLILDIKNLSNWPKILKKETAAELLLSQEKSSSCEYLEIVPKYQSNFSAFVPISNGCNNFCSYCVVPFTRGPLVCRDHREILKEVENVVQKGFKEIWLLGQNVNSYGVQRETDAKQNTKQTRNINFAKLLKMINNIPGDFSIRFMSPHPADFSGELIETMAKCKRVAKFLNLPVQSGDNKILKKMNRPYTVEQYKNLVKKIREKIPNINLSTDVIVGFPGETKKQFGNTVKLFKEIKFNIAYIAKYSPRSGTAAFQMKDDVPWQEKKRRWEILNDIISEKKLNEPETKNYKLITIVGPTASGKSELATKLARKFGGEIISADSRQVYKGMDIGTAKVRRDKPKIKNKKDYFHQGIKHHLLDVVSPKRRFTVTQYRKLALKVIDKIFKNNKLPILCGGTGFYIQAVVDGIVIPEVPPDWKLRKKLEKKSVKELYQILKKLDPERAKTIEKENPRRLIRAIEIVLKTKKPTPSLKKRLLPYPVLMIGIKKSPEELKRRIKKRFFKWLKQGLIKEVENLRKSRLSWKKIEEFGIHYRVVAQYLQNKTLRQTQGKLSYKEMIENSIRQIQNYAKRQLTWFKRDKRIYWIKNYREAKEILEKFLLR